jgi:hypothetical protein
MSHIMKMNPTAVTFGFPSDISRAFKGAIITEALLIPMADVGREDEFVVHLVVSLADGVRVLTPDFEETEEPADPVQVLVDCE